MIEFVTFLDELDWRQSWKIKHRISDIVIITFLGMLCGVTVWDELEDFAKDYLEVLRKYLWLENGIPSHDTMQRAIAAISPKNMGRIMGEWIRLENLGALKELESIISIDGKTMRGNKRNDKKPAHVVTAFLANDGICIGQEATDVKSNEITAIPNLLTQLNIAKSVITIDAMGTQTEIAKTIIEGKADYCLAVKGNQQTLMDDIALYFDTDAHIKETVSEGGYFKTVEPARGGVETREYYICTKAGWLIKNHPGWAKLKAFGMTINTVRKGDAVTAEKRYFILSFQATAEFFAKCVRSHWSIESMHWVLDVCFKEDACHVIDRQTALNQNILRKLSMAILKGMQFRKKNMSYRRKMSSMHRNLEKYMETLFG